MAYAKEAEVVEGTRLVADGGFTCLKDGDVRTVQRDDDNGLFIPCKEGKHFLDGQLDEGEEYIGLTLED